MIAICLFSDRPCLAAPKKNVLLYMLYPLYSKLLYLRYPLYPKYLYLYPKCLTTRLARQNQAHKRVPRDFPISQPHHSPRETLIVLGGSPTGFTPHPKIPQKSQPNPSDEDRWLGEENFDWVFPKPTFWDGLSTAKRTFT